MKTALLALAALLSPIVAMAGEPLPAARAA